MPRRARDHNRPVRFTTGPLGLTASVNSERFVEQTVSEGDEGLYEGPHPVLPDWHIVMVGESFCPCHISQFEFIEGEE